MPTRTSSIIGKRVIYFAGPLFTEGERSWNARIALALSAEGYEILLPQEQAAAIVRAAGGLTAAARASLFDVAIQSIERADAVVAVLDGPDADSGTCFECGYAYAKGRPVLGVRTDLRFGGDDADKGVNLMLGQSCQRFLWVGTEALGDSDVATRRIVDELGSLITADA